MKNIQDVRREEHKKMILKERSRMRQGPPNYVELDIEPVRGGVNYIDKNKVRKTKRVSSGGKNFVHPDIDDKITLIKSSREDRATPQNKKHITEKSEDIPFHSGVNSVHSWRSQAVTGMDDSNIDDDEGANYPIEGGLPRRNYSGVNLGFATIDGDTDQYFEDGYDDEEEGNDDEEGYDDSTQSEVDKEEQSVPMDITELEPGYYYLFYKSSPVLKTNNFSEISQSIMYISSEWHDVKIDDFKVINSLKIGVGVVRLDE